jgi:hypothetical protein
MGGQDWPEAKVPVAVVGECPMGWMGKCQRETALDLAAAKRKLGLDAARLNCLEPDFGAIRRFVWLVSGEW